jgi:YHS domain-containing protein
MIRTVLYLFLAIFAITFLRFVIGIIGKAFGDLAQPGGSSSNAPSSRPATPNAGELKRDPVCGTFVAAASSVKKTVRGEVIHFCSEACRDKYRAE